MRGGVATILRARCGRLLPGGMLPPGRGTAPARPSLGRRMSKQVAKSRVTLANVARRAGVSVTTVSVILSGRPQWLRQFHPETVERVRRVAQRLGYRANLFATSLPKKAPPFFALVLHDIGQGEFSAWYRWSFEGAMLVGAIRAANLRGLYPIVTVSPPDGEEAAVRDVVRVIDGGVSGAVIRTPVSELHGPIRGWLRRGHPIVVVFPPRVAAWPSNVIDVDNRAVGQTAAQLLTRRGRRRWALLRYPRMREALRLRCEAFAAAAQAAGASLRVIRLPGRAEEYQIAGHIAARLADLRPDAVFSPESTPAIGAVLGCHWAGFRPGRDVDVVGCDCSPWRSPPLPTITSVDISWEQVGALAVEKLAAMSREGTGRFETVLLPPRVVAGESCPVE